MVKTNVGAVVSACDALEGLIHKPMDVSLAFLIGRMLKKLKEEKNSYYEAQGKLAEIYAEKNPDGTIKVREDGSTFIPPENRIKFAKEMEPILQQEISIMVDQIPMDKLLGLGEVAPVTLLALADFIIE